VTFQDVLLKLSIGLSFHAQKTRKTCIFEESTQTSPSETWVFHAWKEDGTPTHDMTNRVKVTEASSYVKAWCLTAGVYASKSYDCVIRFETFGSKEDSWTKAAYMFRKMKQNVEFAFIEPLGRPEGSACQEVIDCFSESCLSVNASALGHTGER
jgi:hypothetical protein